VDGIVYAYHADTNAITKDGNPFAAGTGTLDLATTLGGHLTFHFTSGVGFDAGDWHYQSPNNVPNNSLETFHYVIADGDGDQAGADLSITITANDAPHANFDMVLTNFDGVAFNVPEWAFLHNDSDPNGTPIDVTGVLNISDLVVNHTPGVGTNGFITIDDEDTANGGSFDYTITNGTLSDTASVSVSNLNGGGNITGTSAAEILVGDGNSNTFNGAGGGDVILAGAGDDILIGGGGADYMQGDAGADHFRYNATSEGGVFFNQLGADHILDFSAADSIDILTSAFAGAPVDPTAPGVFGSGINNLFGSPTERFHFNTATHTLLYDSNGSDPGGTQVALAVLENSTVNAAQIHMV
jgi:Ca2+-binding RTX toxin-like protein